jgi:hypothetical protein
VVQVDELSDLEECWNGQARTISVMHVTLLSSNKVVTESEDGGLDVMCMGLGTWHSASWWDCRVEEWMYARFCIESR